MSPLRFITHQAGTPFFLSYWSCKLQRCASTAALERWKAHSDRGPVFLRSGSIPWITEAIRHYCPLNSSVKVRGIHAGGRQLCGRSCTLLTFVKHSSEHQKVRGSLLLLFAKVFPPMHTERNTITLQVKLRAFAQWSRSFLISRVVNQQGERVEQALGKCFLWAALSQTSNPTSRSVVCSR